MVTKALYAGSFDPLTLGHLDIIERASNIFDEVVVGVVVNLEKKTMFTFEERMDMIKEVTKHLPNVTVDMCDGLLADYVNANGFNVVVRGLRGVSDFDSEKQMAQLHQYLYKDKVETVFLISDSKYDFISSTMAKQVISLGGDGRCLVPPHILKIMKGKLGK
ncbi:MAG: pantetheine-phosphate adenylyltransferase [Firmicutes bacterium]|nr:pantetheine-phosphate adenylyltransferase [Bacillota bacterium]